MSKREHPYAEVERLKEQYRRLPTIRLQALLPLMSIQKCRMAATAVLQEPEGSHADESRVSHAGCRPAL